MDDTALISSITRTQRLAHQIGSAQMANDVYGWSIKHAMILPYDALKELLEIVAKRHA